MADHESILHTGQISKVNNDVAACRVAQDDFDGLVSGHMQMLFPASDYWNFFWIPKPGDQVAMLRHPNGSSEGYVAGKPYTAGNLPQKGAKGIITMVSADGKNVVKFDALKGTVDLICDQQGTLKFKNLDIEVKEHTHIKTKTYHLEVEEDAVIDVGNNMDTNVGNNVYTGIGGNETIDVGGNITETAGGVNRNDGATVEHD